MIDNFKVFLFTIAVSFSCLLGYGIIANAWWQFIPSTVLIILITRIFYPESWKELLGLKGNIKECARGVLLVFLLGGVSYLAITYSLPAPYQLVFRSYLDLACVPFQSLNEEFLFRSLLLGSLIRIGVMRWKIIFFPALIFSFSHWIFYYFNDLPINNGVVDYSALGTLFLFGITANLLFLQTRSIILPWTLHCAWNLNRFGGRIIDSSNPSLRTPEFLTFNLLEGSTPVFFLAVIVTFLSIYYISRCKHLDQ